MRLVSLVSCMCLLLAAATLNAAQQPEYAVGPSDVLSVTVFGEAELSGKYTVGADGAITFPLVGQTKVAGLTARAIEEELGKRLADGFLKNPQVTVEVAEFASQRVFVIGEVGTPGAQPVRGGATLLEALARAGSLTDRAGGDLLLLRPMTPGGSPGPVLPGAPNVTEVVRISVEDLQRGAVSDNTPLRDGDTIFVPRAEYVYVLGQVRNPGRYTLEKGMTVLRAISQAGGVTQLGTTRRVRIIRVVEGKKTEQTASLDDVVQAGDTIMVPTRWI